MTLQELFTHLSYGELSQISIGGQEAGVINESNFHRLLPHVQAGLTALYKRFTLKEGQVYLTLFPDTTVYPLTSRYLWSGTGQRPTGKHLEHGEVFRFKEDLLKVIRVVNDKGFEFSLNDLGDPYTIKTPDEKTLLIPERIVQQAAGLPDNLKSDTLQIFYRANHPNLAKAYGPYDLQSVTLDPGVSDIELPDAYLEALCYYIASRINNPIGMTNEFHAGNSYYQKFELACQQLEQFGYQIDSSDSTDRLRQKGFV